MRINEPVTTLTDYLLAALTARWGLQLLGTYRARKQVSVLLWALSFTATAVAAVAGGSSHGMKYILRERTQHIVWKMALYPIGAASYLMLSGTLIATVRGLPRGILLAAATTKFLIFTVWMVSHREFRYVLYDYALGMVGVIGLEVHAVRARRGKSAGPIIAGIAVSLAAAVIQRSGFALHKHFNHNDLYHVVQMGATYLFYRGGRQLSDRH